MQAKETHREDRVAEQEVASDLGNELDQETGLYYFGARYYDPRTSVWQSADPGLGGFLGSERIYAPRRLSLFGYAGQNPVRYSDPNGYDFFDFAQGVVEEGLSEVGSELVGAAVMSTNAGEAILGGRYMDAASPYVNMAVGGATAGFALGGRVADFGTDFTNAAATEGSDYQAGVAAFKPVRTAMDTVATALGVSEGFMDTPSSACPGGSCGGPGVCFVAGTPVQTPSGTTPIEQIDLGQRVEAGNPACALDHIDPTDVTISLRLANAAAPLDIVHIKVVRSASWLEAVGLAQGPAWLELKEVGIAGWTSVESIGPAPVEQAGDGCLVLMTVNHVAERVLRLRFEGTDETLELTPSHRLYVEGAGWIEAAGLRPSDQLRATATPLRVRLIEPAGSGRQVFNIEVGREHTYRVGNSGAWAHNACPEGRALQEGEPARPGMRGHHMLPQEFVDMWESVGLNMEEFRVELTPETHEQIHSGKGMGSGGYWNQHWRQFFSGEKAAGRPLTPESVLTQLGDMVAGADLPYSSPVPPP